MKNLSIAKYIIPNYYFERLFAGPLADYRVVQHEAMHEPYPDIGHWDSLLALK